MSLLRPSSLTQEQFAVLVDRAGIMLTPAKFAEMHEAYGLIEALAARLRTPRDLAAEPATVFIPDGSDSPP